MGLCLRRSCEGLLLCARFEGPGAGAEEAEGAGEGFELALRLGVVCEEPVELLLASSARLGGALVSFVPVHGGVLSWLRWRPRATRSRRVRTDRGPVGPGRIGRAVSVGLGGSGGVDARRVLGPGQRSASSRSGRPMAHAPTRPRAGLRWVGMFAWVVMGAPMAADLSRGFRG